MAADGKPTLAVWKFASCDGCQLGVLSLEHELLTLADRLEIAYFNEASSAPVEGPYDVSLVEGSITTPHDAERIRGRRRFRWALMSSSSCHLLIGQPWSSKSTVTWALIGVEVDSVEM